MNKSNKKMGFWGATYLSIGSMVGAGIFSLLGSAIQSAGPLTWISFLLTGVVSLFTAYVLGYKASQDPKSGGILTYVHELYDDSYLVGALNTLFYLSLIVLTAVVGVAFGQYLAALFGLGKYLFVSRVFFILGTLFFLWVNMKGPKLIEASEGVLVIYKLIVLIVFCAVGLVSFNPSYISLYSHEGTYGYWNVLSSMGITFFAYAGFTVVANTADVIKNPKKNIMRALMVSTVVVIILYLLITFTVLGSLSPAKYSTINETVLAQMAYPIFGRLGFILMILAALAATGTTIAANIFGATESAIFLSNTKVLPKIFIRDLWNNPFILYLNVSIVLFLGVFVKFNSLAELGSAFYLITCILFVFGMYLKVRSKHMKLISLLGSIGLAFVLFFWVVFHLTLALATVVVIVTMYILIRGIRTIVKRDAVHKKNKSP